MLLGTNQMREWLKRFFKKREDITLTLNGKTFKQSECKRLGGGSEKHVYKIEGTNQCFFIPHKWRSEEEWDLKIKYEKERLDQIDSLGLKTQRFEVVPLEIKEPGSPTYTINVLITTDFESLCQEESITIYNGKGGEQKVIGTPPDFIAIKERIKDKSFAQKMLKKIINEYAIAFTFSLPISILQSNDDSEHYCFELSQNSNEPPVARYMFWDVTSDFGGLNFPYVPTLDQLKSGARDKSDLFYSPLRGLKFLANQVACAMSEMSSPDDSWAFVKEVQEDLALALNEDAILQEALAQARAQGISFFNKTVSLLLDQFKDIKDRDALNNAFIVIMNSAISLDNLDLVQQTFIKIHINLNDLSKESIKKIIAAAEKYGNPGIIDYLNTNILLEKEKTELQELKNNFIHEYDKKLTSDKSAWCGLYSFFAKSYVNKNMSLKELVQHAQGLSKQGSGKRSQEVMKKMGWLNENNEVTSKISDYLLKI